MSRRPGGMRLLRGRSLLSELIDAQSADLRVQRLAWYPEFRRRSGRSGYSPMALGESSFDHLNFTICQCRKAFVSRRVCRVACEPALINDEGIGFAEDDGTFHDVLQFANIPGPRVAL